MQAYVEPAPIKVETHRFHEGLAEPSLDICRKWALERLNGGQALLAISRPLNEIRDGAAELAKERIDLALAQPRST
jgi:hypothetical protein